MTRERALLGTDFVSGLLVSTQPAGAARHRAALRALAPLGGDRSVTWERSGVSVTVTRKAWELTADFSANILVLETPHVVVAADAMIVEREALLRALRDAAVVPAAHTPSHLIAAAYEAWGADLVSHLRGDYAFCLWDARRQLLIAARDPIGGRPLYYGDGGAGCVVGSSSRAVAEVVGRASQLDLATLGTQVAGFAWAMGSHTAFRGVDPILPGHRLVVERGRRSLSRFWRPPSDVLSAPSPIAEAAEELRTILRSAVRDRLAADTSTVWMSGGWDSTAVFAAGLLPINFL